MIEEIRFGRKICKKRSVGNARFFGYLRRWSTEALRDDDARCGLQNRTPLLIVLGLGMKLKYT